MCKENLYAKMEELEVQICRCTRQDLSYALLTTTGCGGATPFHTSFSPVQMHPSNSKSTVNNAPTGAAHNMHFIVMPKHKC